MDGKPIKVGITQGDPNGIGYEVIFKAVAEEGVVDLFTPVIFGVPEFAEKALQELDYQNAKLNIITDLSGVKDGRLNLLALACNPPQLKPGETDKDAGKSAVAALESAVEALKQGEIDVLVTAPISKEAVQSDTFHFPGHTEFLSERLGNGEDALMILCNNDLRVALLTKHIPVSQIPENISKDAIVKTVEKFSTTLKKDFGIVRPTIAVLSLNPHAGDGGLLGTEEEEIIKPAIEELQKAGVLVFGPFPSDGFFGHGSYKNFDGVLAMYHDQGLAPFKTLASSSGGVNFSAGLPFVRTSPDHGTAFDIAWRGDADATSMREAIYLAIDIYRRRRIYEEASSNPLKKYSHERSERAERFEKNDLKEETDD